MDKFSGKKHGFDSDEALKAALKEAAAEYPEADGFYVEDGEVGVVWGRPLGGLANFFNHAEIAKNKGENR